MLLKFQKKIKRTKCGETLSRLYMFDVSFQSKLKRRRKERNNSSQIFKHRHRHDFLSINLMNDERV